MSPLPRLSIIGSNKGISPILATLLLVVITTTAAVMTYSWVMSYISSKGEKAEAVMLYLANVRFTNSTSGGGTGVVIDIGNAGTTSTKVRIYGGNAPNNLTLICSSKTIPAGGIQTFQANMTWVSKKTYYFRAVSDFGVSIEFNAKAP